MTSNMATDQAVADALEALRLLDREAELGWQEPPGYDRAAVVDRANRAFVVLYHAIAAAPKDRQAWLAAQFVAALKPATFHATVAPKRARAQTPRAIVGVAKL